MEWVTRTLEHMKSATTYRLDRLDDKDGSNWLRLWAAALSPAHSTVKCLLFLSYLKTYHFTGRRKHFNLQNDFYHILNILITLWSSALVKVVSPWSWDSCWSQEDLPWPCTLPCSVVSLCSPIPGSAWDVRTEDIHTYQNGAFPFFFLLSQALREKKKEQEFFYHRIFNLGTLQVWGQMILCCWNCLCTKGCVAESSGLYLLDVSRIPVPHWTSRNVSRGHCQRSRGQG